MAKLIVPKMCYRLKAYPDHNGKIHEPRQQKLKYHLRHPARRGGLISVCNIILWDERIDKARMISNCPADRICKRCLGAMEAVETADDALLS